MNKIIVCACILLFSAAGCGKKPNFLVYRNDYGGYVFENNSDDTLYVESYHENGTPFHYKVLRDSSIALNEQRAYWGGFKFKMIYKSK